MTTQTDSLMTRLREQTREQHRRAEENPLQRAMALGTITRGAYGLMLSQRYLIHRELESRLVELSGRDKTIATIAQQDLFQEPNLYRDLAALRIDVDELKPMDPTRRFLGTIRRLAEQTPRALLGVLYVLEGSKNGARFLATKLARPLGLAPDQPGLLYQDPHGAEQPALWAKFKAAMDAAVFSVEDRDAVVAAATATFEAISAIDEKAYSGSASASQS